MRLTLSQRKLAFCGPKICALLTCGALAAPISSQACNCRLITDPPAKQVTDYLASGTAFRKVTVFQGTVVGIETIGMRRHVSFSADRYWASAVSRDVMVETGLGDGDCGYDFQVGREYLVFADDYRNGGWYTNICSLTTQNAAGYIGSLGKAVELPAAPSGWPFLRFIAFALIAIPLGWRFTRRALGSKKTRTDAGPNVLLAAVAISASTVCGCGRKPVLTQLPAKPTVAAAIPPVKQMQPGGPEAVFEISYAFEPAMHARNPHTYAITLRSTGIATLMTRHGALPTGTYESFVSTKTFEKLAANVLADDLPDFNLYYGHMVSDAAENYVSVVYRGKRTTVRYAGWSSSASEAKVLAVLKRWELTMQDLMAKTKWVKKSSTVDLRYPLLK